MPEEIVVDKISDSDAKEKSEVFEYGDHMNDQEKEDIDAIQPSDENQPSSPENKNDNFFEQLKINALNK